MHRNKVKEILTQYKENQNDIELHEEVANIGASFVSVGGGEKNNHSKVEEEADYRFENEQEIKKKEQFNELVDIALNKLKPTQKEIIRHKYNMIKDKSYQRYDIGAVPDTDIAAWDKMPSRPSVNLKRNQAIQELCTLFDKLNLDKYIFNSG